MDIVLIRTWRALAIRGVANIAFGVVALAWPRLTVEAIVLIFGAYSLIDGTIAIVAGAHQRMRAQRWPLVISGLLGVAVGLGAILLTEASTHVLMYLIAVWAIATGVLEIWAATLLRHEVPGALYLGAGGFASVVFGVLVATSPGAGAEILAAFLGCYALFFGLSTLIVALQVRRLATRGGSFDRRLRHRMV